MAYQGTHTHHGPDKGLGSPRPFHGRRPSDPVARISLIVLAVLGVLGFVYFARPVLLPFVVAVLAYFVLAPLVRGLRKMWVPRPIGATLVLGVTLGGTAYGLVALAGPASKWARELPSTATELAGLMRELQEPVEEVQRATKDLADLADGEERDGATPVRVEGPGLIDGVVSRTQELSVTFFLSVVLLFFLLAREEQFVAMLESALSGAQGGVEASHDVRHEVSMYLLTVTLINLGLGVVVGVILWAFGLPSPVLWGVAVALLNFVPYLGAVVGSSLVIVAGLVTFDTFAAALWPAGCYLAVNVIEGTFITPAILGRRFLLSPFVLFLWLMLWSWMWGVPGALLAVPLLVIVRIASDRVPALRPLSRILAG